jgi:DNA-binding beta-propeller fold protein YncE
MRPGRPASVRGGLAAAACVALAIAGAGATVTAGCSRGRTPSCVGICARPTLSRLDVLAGQPGGPGWVDGPRATAHFAEPWVLANDGHRRLYVADLHVLRAVDLAAGVVTTLAGDHHHAGAVDGVGARAAFNTPSGLAFDAGQLFVADTENHVIRRVDVASGAVSVIAGVLGSPGAVDAVGPDARFREPEGLALDDRGHLYIGDTDNNCIRMLAIGSGAVTTIAGSPATAGTGDGVGAAARFNKPKGLALDGRGHLYAIDAVNQSVRIVRLETGAVSTLVQFETLPQGLASDGADLLVSLGDHRVVRVTAGGAVSPLAGRAGVKGFVDGAAGDARFDSPAGLWNDGAGTLYVADPGNSVVRTISLADGAVATYAGGRSAGRDDGAGPAARFSAPQGLAADAHTVYVADSGNAVIRAIAIPSGDVTTLAGAPGSPGLADGPLAGARFNQPQGLALDEDARALYVADTQNRKIRRIDLRAATVTTLAFTRAPGDAFSGFDAPSGLAIDRGRLFVTDYTNHVVAAIDLKDLRLSTFAGTYGVPGRANGVTMRAAFYGPLGIAADGRGHLFVADDLNQTVRAIDIASGTVTTLAGQPVTPGSGDGVGPAAHFHYPVGIAADGAGDVFVADSFNGTVRRVDPATGAVTTAIGTLDASGVRTGPLPAQLSKPSALALTPGGGLLVVSENAVLVAH